MFLKICHKFMPAAFRILFCLFHAQILLFTGLISSVPWSDHQFPLTRSSVSCAQISSFLAQIISVQLSDLPYRFSSRIFDVNRSDVNSFKPILTIILFKLITFSWSVDKTSLNIKLNITTLLSVYL